jgi:hypothetical protein
MVRLFPIIGRTMSRLSSERLNANGKPKLTAGDGEQISRSSRDRRSIPRRAES